ncbi:hypothetical protein [Streptomyces sp. NPDC047028]|uniref:hypothetical protein n=1 Tax=Streptomyces sp. NPDC047028 TaxID=3155793 RepID=UPI0033E0E050
MKAKMKSPPRHHMDRFEAAMGGAADEDLESLRELTGREHLCPVTVNSSHDRPMRMKAVDRFGKEITPGTRVTYAHRGKLCGGVVVYVTAETSDFAQVVIDDPDSGLVIRRGAPERSHNRYDDLIAVLAGS